MLLLVLLVLLLLLLLLLLPLLLHASTAHFEQVAVALWERRRNYYPCLLRVSLLESHLTYQCTCMHE